LTKGVQTVKGRRGFTLIELLVVIAIIAILAAILFPVFAQARATARATTCLSNLKQLGLGMLMYVQDYDEAFPAWSYNFNCGGLNNGAPRDSGAFWTTAIYPYVKNDGIYRCPDDPIKFNDLWAGCSDDGGINDRFGPYNPATGKTPNPNYVSYGLPEDLTPPFPTNAMAAVRTPSNWMMLADSFVQLVDIFVWDVPSADRKDWIAQKVAFAANNFDSWSMPWDGYYPASYYIDKYGAAACDRAGRHKAGANLVYVDGHAKFGKWSYMTWMNLSTGTLTP